MSTETEREEAVRRAQERLDEQLRQAIEAVNAYAAAMAQQAAAIADLALQVGELAKANATLVGTFFVAANTEDTAEPAHGSQSKVPRTMDDPPLKG